MNWKTIRADEFCESVRDGTHDTPKPTETGYKLVTGKHVKNGQIDLSDAYYISGKDYEKINERSLVAQWDVLMSMIGTVGEVAVVKNHPNYAIKNVALFKCGGSELKGKWLAFYLRSSDAQGHMSGNQKGSSQQFLSLNIDIDSLKQNLAMMIPKLESFMHGWNKANQPTRYSPPSTPDVNVTVTNNVTVNITFEQVRAKIEDMTSLTDEQTKEALDKVSEIEAVVKGGGSKKSKWEKIKPILVWLADKSFDVAMTILPLLLNIQG